MNLSEKVEVQKGIDTYRT